MNNTEILQHIKIDVLNEIDRVANNLNINQLLKLILITLEDTFNPLHMDISSDYFSKESLAEELSYLLHCKLCKYKNKIDLHDFFRQDYEKLHTDKSNAINELFSLLRLRSHVNDLNIYVEKQGYAITVNKNAISISHEIADYYYYYKLGYLRSKMEDMFVTFTSMEDTKVGVTDILEAATKYKILELMDYHIARQGTPSEAIVFKFAPELIAHLTRFLTNSHGAKYNHIMHKYLSNSQIDFYDKCTKHGCMTWADLFNFSIVLEYISVFISKTIDDNSTSIRMSVNSKLLLLGNDEVFDFIKLIFMQINNKISDKEIKNFIGRFTTDILDVSKRMDLQFNPIIKIGKHSFVLFNTFASTDLVRAYINNNNVALDDQGNKFEDEVLGRLKKHFRYTKNNIEYTYAQQAGQIDICIIGNKNIYFMECKNRLHPISATSSINNYQYILKAIEQLQRAEEYFNSDRNAFMRTHFNISVEDIEGFALHKVIMLSNRNCSGINHQDIAVRDIYSLDKLLESGYINVFNAGVDGKNELLNSISLYENNFSFQEVDFVNYISKNSKYFNVLKAIVSNVEYAIDYKEYSIMTNELALTY